MKVFIGDGYYLWGNYNYKFRFIDSYYKELIFYLSGLPRDRNITPDYIIKNIISSGWDKNDFLKFFEYWKKNNPKYNSYFERNLDKFLNEALIKSIIE